MPGPLDLANIVELDAATIYYRTDNLDSVWINSYNMDGLDLLNSHSLGSIVCRSLDGVLPSWRPCSPRSAGS